jgi:hypothetical protein
MNTQHTPGLWHVEGEQNVRAVAAELLAALRLMLEDYRSEGCANPDCGVCKRSKAAEAAARAAIARAEGK